jgi:chromate transporter
VVGILAAALYDPLWTTGIRSIADVAIAATAFLLLTGLRAPPILTVALCAVLAVGVGVGDAG